MPKARESPRSKDHRLKAGLSVLLSIDHLAVERNAEGTEQQSRFTVLSSRCVKSDVETGDHVWGVPGGCQDGLVVERRKKKRKGGGRGKEEGGGEREDRVV